MGLGQTIFDPHFKPGHVQRTLGQLLNPMMAHLPELNAHRQTITSIYQKNITAQCLISVPEGSAPVYLRFPILGSKEPLPAELLRLGVRKLYPKAINQEPQINAYANNPEQRLNGAETLAKTLVTLPTHHSITNRIAETIAFKTNDWLRQGYYPSAPPR
jgi:dTDP-4-amino-4,6-dideoxygalactose transaminase